MIIYMTKSVIILALLYTTYWFLLRQSKAFLFNRFFILGSLICSLVLPFIRISTLASDIPLVTESSTTLSNGLALSAEFTTKIYQKYQSEIRLWPIIYSLIGALLLMRFGINLLSIIQQIRQNEKVRFSGKTLVLALGDVQPHSFFNYIFINRAQFRQGKIDPLLLQHEITHGQLWHSLDIVFIELLKVACWINPFIWIFKKQLQLNHEYAADQAVLKQNKASEYQHVLFDQVIGKPDSVFISHFNYSFTKQRLIMMTKEIHPARTFLGTFTAALLFILTTVFIGCQNPAIDEQMSKIIRTEDLASEKSVQEDWWKPILKSHNITSRAYNNFPNVFEMGSSNRINNGVVELENAFFLFRPVDFHSKEVDETSYMMMRAPFATHNLSNDSIKANNGNIRVFHLEHDQIKSVQHIEFTDITIIVNGEKAYFNANSLKSRIENAEGNILKPESYSYNLSVRW